MYLIGGNNGGRDDALFKRVWEAEINYKHKVFDLDFHEMNSHMDIPRWNHFTLCVKDKMYVFCGETDRETSQVEIFDGKSWTLGPKFDVKLNREQGDAAVLVDKSVILVTSKRHGIIIYDISKKRFRRLDGPEMKDKRNEYVVFSI